jgi:anti-sigma factor RsiW
MTHETDEDLSALIDGELPAEAAARARAHTASCAECAARLDRLSAASLMFKRSGERPVPAGLAERAKGAAKPRRFATPRLLEAVAAVTLVVGLILVTGALLKKFRPSLFDNVQQMITGAAGQMGGK